MDDTSAVALEDGLDHLAEEVLGQGFRQGTAFRDEVEQILRGFCTLHDQHEDVLRVARVQQPHHAADVRYLPQQTRFQRHSQTTNLRHQFIRYLHNTFLTHFLPISYFEILFKK